MLFFEYTKGKNNVLMSHNRCSCQSSWCVRLFPRRVFYCKVVQGGRDQSSSRHYRDYVHDEKKRVDVVGSTNPKYNNYRFPLSVYMTGQIGR